MPIPLRQPITTPPPPAPKEPPAASSTSSSAAAAWDHPAPPTEAVARNGQPEKRGASILLRALTTATKPKYKDMSEKEIQLMFEWCHEHDKPDSDVDFELREAGLQKKKLVF
jgi:hypothetical protein